MIPEQKSKPLQPPWKLQDVNPAAKLGAMFGVTIILLCVIPPAAVGLISSLVMPLADKEALSGLLAKPSTLLFTIIFGLLVPLLVLGLCVFGLRKLWRYASAPKDFKIMAVAANTAGQPFEVRFAHLMSFTSRSFNGKGFCRFDEEKITLDGTSWPSPAFQLGVIVVVTVLPLVIFGFGLGLIPALILAYFLGKKQMSQEVHYKDILDLSVKGRTVTITFSGESPNKVKFTTASADGERLYRELYSRYPKAVTEWSSWLRPALDPSLSV